MSPRTRTVGARLAGVAAVLCALALVAAPTGVAAQDVTVPPTPVPSTTVPPVPSTTVPPVPAPPPDPSCEGVVLDVALEAPDLPQGRRSAAGVCVPPDAAYETAVLGYRLVGALGVAGFDDGTIGRVAVLSVHLAPDRAATLLGVEDSATGRVTWAYAEGGQSAEGDARTVGGPAETVSLVAGQPQGPVTQGSLQVTVTGRGTDLATAQGPVPDQIRAALDEAVAALTS